MGPAEIKVTVTLKGQLAQEVLEWADLNIGGPRMLTEAVHVLLLAGILANGFLKAREGAYNADPMIEVTYPNSEPKEYDYAADDRAFDAARETRGR